MPKELPSKNSNPKSLKFLGIDILFQFFFFLSEGSVNLKPNFLSSFSDKLITF